MSNFEDLCQEIDEKKRKAGMLRVVFGNSRKKVADILLDKHTQCDVHLDAKKRVTSITYQNVLGKVILTPSGIDMVNSSGTAWAVSN